MRVTSKTLVILDLARWKASLLLVVGALTFKRALCGMRVAWVRVATLNVWPSYQFLLCPIITPLRPRLASVELVWLHGGMGPCADTGVSRTLCCVQQLVGCLGGACTPHFPRTGFTRPACCLRPCTQELHALSTVAHLFARQRSRGGKGKLRTLKTDPSQRPVKMFGSVLSAEGISRTCPTKIPAHPP